mmetsp:Transcript_30177/g.87676  ORF Transcript_30177/g.87676 Transcript_30177/m.87676 type:complete len:91 (+) Transcript_30177:329-601(+)
MMCAVPVGVATVCCQQTDRHQDGENAAVVLPQCACRSDLMHTHSQTRNSQTADRQRERERERNANRPRHTDTHTETRERESEREGRLGVR